MGIGTYLARARKDRSPRRARPTSPHEGDGPPAPLAPAPRGRYTVGTIHRHYRGGDIHVRRTTSRGRGPYFQLVRSYRPREWVDAAREAIRGNKAPSAVSGRSWELSGGILYRGDRGCRMATHTTIERKGEARANGTTTTAARSDGGTGWWTPARTPGTDGPSRSKTRFGGSSPGCSRTRRGCAGDQKS